MARRKGRKADDHADKLALILERAAALFAGRGYGATSIADLAAACGCSKALIFHYAHSKEMILYTLVHRQLETLRGAAIEAYRASDDPARQLHALVRHFLVIQANMPDRQRVLLREYDALPPEMRAELAAWQRELVDGVAALLVRLNPRLGADGLARPYALLFAGMLCWTHTWFDPNGRIDLAAFFPMAANLYLNGVLQAPQDRMP